MTLLRLSLGLSTLALLLAGCGSNLCERSTRAAQATLGDCGDTFVPPLLGGMCSANLSACTEADQKVLATALTCVEKLPACSSIAKDAWRLQQEGCTNELAQLSRACLDTFFTNTVYFDAGLPDAGPQSINDGGNGLGLVGAANQDTVALAWELRREAPIARYLLVETDAVGENRTETEFTPGSSINLTIPDSGMAGRRYFVVGVNAAGEVLTGTPFGQTTVDAGAMCQGLNDCPSDRVCDLGLCRVQTCQFGMANTCPASYSCFSPGECRRTGDDGGVYVPPVPTRDAGSEPLPMISNEIGLTPRPPMVSPLVPVGAVAARYVDLAAFDTARVTLALEQEGQIIAHPSSARGNDLADESNTSAGLDTTGSRVHLTWHPDTRALYACYVVGRGVRVQKSTDQGRTWGSVATTFEPPLPDDGGVGEIIRDCDIAPWKNGGAMLVTAETEALVVRELTPTLDVAFKGPAFTSIAPDAGTAAIFAPSHPAIATHVGNQVVHVTFTGTRLLTGGASDTEPYGVVREGSGSFSPAARMTPSAAPSALPEDWTTVAIHPKTGRAIGAFTTVVTGTQSSTVFVALYAPMTRTWGTGTHLNVFLVDQNTSVVLPQKPPTETWFAFSPQFAPLPDGTFAFSFVAGPRSASGVGDYRQYLVPFDLDRTPATTNGRGWFVLPVLKVSDARVLDPRGSIAAPQRPVSALAADNQISVYGAFISGGGQAGDVEGPAQFFHYP